MASKKKLPSSGYLVGLRQVLERKFDKRNKMLEGLRQRRFQEHAPAIPNEYKRTGVEFRAPIIYDFDRRVQAIMGRVMPTAKVIPIKFGTEAQKNYTKREKWLNEGAYRKMQSDNPVYPMLVDAVASDGMGIVKVLPTRYKWGEIARRDDESDEDWSIRYEDQKKQNFPFRWEHVDTTTFYPVYDEQGLAEVLEVTKRETLPLARKYGLVADQSGKLSQVGRRVSGVLDSTEDYPETVSFTEYWSRDSFCYMIDDVVVDGGEHKCGRPPYFVAFATVTSSKDPSRMYQPLSLPLQALQDAVDSLGTIGLNWVYLSGFPQPVLKPVMPEAVDPEKGDEVLELNPTKLMTPPYGWEFGYVGPPPASAEIAAMRDFLLNMVDKVSLAPILTGIMPGSGTAGVTANTMIAVAKSIFGPAVDSISRAFDDIAAYMLRYIDQVIKDDVPVFSFGDSGGKNGWMELGPSDIKGYYEVRHALEPVIPAERQAQGIFLADAQARGAISMKRLRVDGYGLNDPEAESTQIQIEDLGKSPELRSLKIQKVMERIGLAEPAQDQGSQPAIPVGPGGPGEPIVPGVQHGMGPGSAPIMPEPAPGTPGTNPNPALGGGF